MSGNQLEKTNNFYFTKLPHTHPPQKLMKKYMDNPKTFWLFGCQKVINTPEKSKKVNALITPYAQLKNG